MATNEEEQLLLMGNDADALLKQEGFMRVVNNLVENTFQSFVNSKPDESEIRESLYHQYRALILIMETLQQRVSVRDQIIERREDANTSKWRSSTMDNVQDTKPQSLNLDQAQDAILAKWQVPDDDDQQTETETIAPEPEVEETDEGVLEIEDDEDDVVDQDDETDPDDEEVEPEEEDEDEEEEETAEAKPLDDEQKVEVLVDGETKSVSVRALKRLYGQEASLTRKF